MLLILTPHLKKYFKNYHLLLKNKFICKRLNNYMSEKKKKKKVNRLNLKECEEIIKRLGGQLECQYLQQVMNQYNTLVALKEFNKK
jgi:hypothetical protein